MRIVLDGLRGKHSIAELSRREDIAEGHYYRWSREFLEAGRRRRAGFWPDQNQIPLLHIIRLRKRGPVR